MATVLIVDEDVKLRKMLGRTLTHEGFRVVSAGNGEEALAEAQANRPDLIVLDWTIPGLEEVETVERQQEGDARAPVLVLTARESVDNRPAWVDSVADDYLAKPFAPAELLAHVRGLLKRRAIAGKD